MRLLKKKQPIETVVLAYQSTLYVDLFWNKIHIKVLHVTADNGK